MHVAAWYHGTPKFGELVSIGQIPDTNAAKFRCTEFRQKVCVVAKILPSVIQTDRDDL